MPSYNFLNKKTKREYTKSMSMSARETYLAEHPDIEQILTSPNPTVDIYRMGMKKPDESFREILREVKKNHRGSTINTFD